MQRARAFGTTWQDGFRLRRGRRFQRPKPRREPFVVPPIRVRKDHEHGLVVNAGHVRARVGDQVGARERQRRRRRMGARVLVGSDRQVRELAEQVVGQPIGSLKVGILAERVRISHIVSVNQDKGGSNGNVGSGLAVLGAPGIQRGSETAGGKHEQHARSDLGIPKALPAHLWSLPSRAVRGEQRQRRARGEPHAASGDWRVGEDASVRTSGLPRVRRCVGSRRRNERSAITRRLRRGSRDGVPAPHGSTSARAAHSPPQHLGSYARRDHLASGGRSARQQSGGIT